MFYNFRKNNLDSERIYSVYPNHIDNRFMYLLHLLTDENIHLTFNDKDKLYEYIENIIKLLEDRN